MRRVNSMTGVAATLLGGAALLTLAGGVTATTTSPRVAVFPSSVSFGSQPVGSLQQRSVSVENVGDAPLHVHSVYLNDYSGSYSLAFNGCGGATIPPGQLCQFVIQFHPRTPGQHTASALINDDAPGGTQNVPVWGQATGR